MVRRVGLLNKVLAEDRSGRSDLTREVVKMRTRVLGKTDFTRRGTEGLGRRSGAREKFGPAKQLWQKETLTHASIFPWPNVPFLGNCSIEQSHQIIPVLSVSFGEAIETHIANETHPWGTEVAD